MDLIQDILHNSIKAQQTRLGINAYLKKALCCQHESDSDWLHSRIMLLKAYLVTNYTEDKQAINQSPKKLTIKILCAEVLNISGCCPHLSFGLAVSMLLCYVTFSHSKVIVNWHKCILPFLNYKFHVLTTQQYAES